MRLKSNRDPTDNKKKTYDYITTMQLFSLTQEKIDELNDKLKNKQEELAYVNSQSEIEMWNLELKEFSKAYKKWKVITEKPYNEDLVFTFNKTRKSTKIKRNKNKNKNKKKKKKKTKITVV